MAAPLRGFARPTLARLRLSHRYPLVLGSRAQSTSTLPLPPGSWDSHVHVICNEFKFPYHPEAGYRPQEAPLSRLQTFHANLHPHITHHVLVALSIHGTDNSCLLESLKTLAAQSLPARGVASIDPLVVSDSELQILHAAGVRGARMNLKSSLLEPSAADFERTLRAYADRLKPLKSWPLQIHLSLRQIPLIADILPRLGVPVIIDHLAAPDAATQPLRPAQEQEGYKEFMRLLARGEVYTKLSGSDRFAALPLLDEYATEVVAVAPQRVVWATDWPHTGGVKMNPGGNRRKQQGFRAVDDHGKLRRAMEVYCRGDESVIKQVWRDNARELWDYDGED
ncbi:hypothetical protein DRE_03536 [Drechslerella stenobrocha 248]|uniref:Amidohydrolase-related domain-containing protein n=1 Tax=Drechslerella stenobrocha 248 TaxID=1043628 RepID=W7I418_9PEZI|nr:hypothetical protein DRE_03536 [Drechslerella stenobrocha 248]